MMTQIKSTKTSPNKLSSSPNIDAKEKGKMPVSRNNKKELNRISTQKITRNKTNDQVNYNNDDDEENKSAPGGFGPLSDENEPQTGDAVDVIVKRVSPKVDR